MSTGTILLIAIPVVLVLAALFLVVTARNSDRNAATGLLARETEKRDRARRKTERAADEAPPAAGRTLERSTALAQRGGGTVAVLERNTELDVLRPPMDEEQLGQTRRQFFNRSIIVMFLLSLGGLAERSWHFCGRASVAVSVQRSERVRQTKFLTQLSRRASRSTSQTPAPTSCPTPPAP
jgi:cytochrome b6-f complex iron-sulfur subunit